MSLLVATDLTKVYGRKIVVDHLNFAVDKGDFTALIGGNGSGKSTTLKMCSSLAVPTSGTVTVGGHDVCDDRAEAMKSIGCVIESPEFYPARTPNEMLRYLCRLDGMTKEQSASESARVLDLVGASEYADRRSGKFSKGMRQRVVLASALLGEPELLLLDEPTSGLDPRGSYEIREILRRLNADGMTILVSTHMLNDIDGLCDSMVIIDRGRMVRQGKVSDMGLTAVLRITTASSPDQRTLDVVRGMDGVSSVSIHAGRLEVSIEGDDKARSSFLKALMDAGIEVCGVEDGNAFERTFFDSTGVEERA